MSSHVRVADGEEGSPGQPSSLEAMPAGREGC
jgi:hypothetical protein